MNNLYKSNRTVSPVLQWMGAVISAAAYIVCCLPSFYRIGQFFLQTVSAVSLSLFCTAALFFLLPRSLQMIGKGLSLFLIVMLAYAGYEQILAQINAGGFQFWWIHTFFYDRPFTVAMVWCTAFVSVLLLRLFSPFTESYAVFRSDYVEFFRSSFHSFMVFYVLMLIYCFLLQRKPGGDSGLNLVPFAMFFSYFQNIKSSYESTFYLLGNLLCFLPFGFLVRVRREKWSAVYIVLFPVLLSLLIEISQLIFSMGDFDVDDIWMNAIGYYAGYGFALLFDFVRKKRTAGEETTIFSSAA